jgi:hypothetical protein
MINATQSERLKANWGYKADAMACMAEVRLYDPMSHWQCFIYAMNPEDDNEIQCILSVGNNTAPAIARWTLPEIIALYNSIGEGVQIDPEYRPRMASQIFKMLNDRTI